MAYGSTSAGAAKAAPTKQHCLLFLWYNQLMSLKGVHVFKIIISILLTIFLGPGAGHLYLRRFKQGLLLIGGTFAFALILVWQIGREVGLAALRQQPFNLIYQEFAREHPNAFLYHDVVLAALWTYALIDAFKIARSLMPAPETPDE